MKLTELTNHITPLPWHINSHGSDGVEHDAGSNHAGFRFQAIAATHDAAEAHASYLAHAANVLPDTVAALKLLLDDQQRPKSELSRAQFEFCEETLARAENITTEQGVNHATGTHHR
jgi:hypothetical protein